MLTLLIRYARWLVVALALGLALTMTFWRGQDSNWDLLNYHLFMGFSVWHGGFWRDVAPVGLQSFLHPLVNVPAFLAFAALPFPVGAWALVLLQLTVLWPLLLLARQVGQALGQSALTAAQALALVLCLLAPTWASELGTSFTDASVATLVLLGLSLALRAIANDKLLPALVAGVLLGVAVGLKLTHALFAVALVLALLAACWGIRAGVALRRLGLLGLGLLLGWLLMAWWHYFLWQRWGSPVFPLYNAWFKSPYALLLNFRDARWQFGSVADFGQFVWAAAWGTSKTSEMPFADARWLLVAGLLLLALPFGRKPVAQPRVALAFGVFVLLGIGLWAVMLAYQRYVIALELLLGLAIWVLLARMTSTPGRQAWLLAGCVALCASAVRVPDWGHLPASAGQRNPFGVNLPAWVTQTPARYLVLGVPISYVLPALHPDSVFYGLQGDALLNEKMTELKRMAVTTPDALPLRFVIREAAVGDTLWQTLAGVGLTPQHTAVTCVHFQTRIDLYVLCQVLPAGAAALAATEVDFTQDSAGLPATVLGLDGLSHPEPWGRWSEGDAVRVTFGRCLPRGPLRIDLRAQAFARNAGQPVRVALGQAQAQVVLPATVADVHVTLNNQAACENTLTLFVPQKVSPASLGLSADTRTLGIGLVRLGLRPEN